MKTSHKFWQSPSNKTGPNENQSNEIQSNENWRNKRLRLSRQSRTETRYFFQKIELDKPFRSQLLRFPSIIFWLTITCFCFLPQKHVFSNRLTPGLFESLKIVTKYTEDQFRKEQRKALKDLPKNQTENQGQKTSSASGSSDSDPYFTEATLIHHLLFVNEKHFGPVNGDACRFIETLEYFYPDRPLIVSYGKTKKSSLKKTSANRFFNAYKNICRKSNELKAKYSKNPLETGHINALLRNPTDFQDCLNIHSGLAQSHDTIHLCRLNQQVKQGIKANRILTKNTKGVSNIDQLRKQVITGRKIRQALNKEHLNYIDNLCESLFSPKLFCQGFFSNSPLRRIIQKVDYYANSLCPRVTRKKKFSLNSCLEKIEKNTNSCALQSSSGRALAPFYDCETTEKLLRKTRISEYPYSDCSLGIDNHALVNLGRLLQYTRPRFQGNFAQKFQNRSSDCTEPYAHNSALFANNNDFNHLWGQEICYLDGLTTNEQCLPIIFSSIKESPLSVTNVIKKILTRSRGMPNSQECQFIPRKSFNPQLLKYQNGCYITFIPGQCKVNQCPIEVFYDSRLIVDLFKIKNTREFNYGIKKLGLNRTPLSKAYEQTGKLKTKVIKSLTEADLLFSEVTKENKKLAHGLGCLEDLLPIAHRRVALGQCKPVSFLILGKFESDKSIKKDYFITLLSIEDSHNYRLINWNRIYHAVDNYKIYSHSNDWTLYASNY